MSQRYDKRRHVHKTMIGLVLGASLSTLAAQEKADSLAVSKADTAVAKGDSGWVSLRSNPPGAEVYRDTTFLGRTPLIRLQTDAGNRVFRLFYPEAGCWSAAAQIDTVSVRPGVETTSLVDLDIPAGIGPRRQYVPATETNPDLFLATPHQTNSKLWMSYAAGATMVVSGVLSAYLKTKSDKDFDSYVATGDPNLLDSTHRLDRLAGVSLFVTELSLGALIYLLLSD